MKNALTIAALLLFVLAAGCGGNKTAPAAPTPAEEPETTALAEEPAPVAPAPAEEPTEKTEEAVKPGGILTEQLSSDKLPENLFLNVKVKDHGTMKLRFHTKDAPLNVTNVANLAIKGFYNGLTFHRIVPGFVVQGGDPQGDGTGGPGYDVQAEIKHKHMKGSIAMARTGDQVNPQRRSSGSQFYLCIEPLPMLDNQYTVIGDMVEGLEVLAKLGQVKTGAMDRPVTPVVMESVTVTTR